VPREQPVKNKSAAALPWGPGAGRPHCELTPELGLSWPLVSRYARVAGLWSRELGWSLEFWSVVGVGVWELEPWFGVGVLE
jgi:hypothetical protein